MDTNYKRFFEAFSEGVALANSVLSVKVHKTADIVEIRDGMCQDRTSATGVENGGRVKQPLLKLTRFTRNQ